MARVTHDLPKLSTGPKWPGYHDPLTVADRMWWVREHYISNHDQPADLPDFMKRAAETLERCVPIWWRNLAAAEAVLLIICAILLQRSGW